MNEDDAVIINPGADIEDPDYPSEEEEGDTSEDELTPKSPPSRGRRRRRRGEEEPPPADRPHFQVDPTRLVGGPPRLFIEYEALARDAPPDTPRKFIVHENVLKMFENELRAPTKLHVVSIAGPARSGKSFVMNRMFDIDGTYPKGGFELGATVNPCTHGIWVWVRRIPVPLYDDDFEDEEGGRKKIIGSEERIIVMLDTEGLGSSESHASDDFDNKVLCLSVLLSSTFVWNSMSTIDRDAISKLGFITSASNLIRFSSQDIDFKGGTTKRHLKRYPGRSPETETEEEEEGEEGEEEEIVPVTITDPSIQNTRLNQFFPNFVWLVRDFFLELTENQEELSDDDYLKHSLDKAGTEVENVRQIISGLKNYFPLRNCFTLVRPIFREQKLRYVEKFCTDIRPEFEQKMEQVILHLRGRTEPRRSFGTYWTGGMFAQMARCFVDSINDKNFVHIDRTFEGVQKSMNRALIKQFAEQYAEEMELRWNQCVRDERTPLSRSALLEVHRSIFLPMYSDFLESILIAEQDFYVKGSKKMGRTTFKVIDENGVEKEETMVAPKNMRKDLQGELRVDRWTVELFGHVEGYPCKPGTGVFRRYVARNEKMTEDDCTQYLKSEWAPIEENVRLERRYFPSEGDPQTADFADELLQRYYDDRQRALEKYDFNARGDSLIKRDVRKRFLEDKNGEVETVKLAIKKICEGIELIAVSKVAKEIAEEEARDANDEKKRAVDDLRHAHIEHAKRLEDLKADQQRRMAEQMEKTERLLREQKREMAEAAEANLAEVEARNAETIAVLKKKQKKAKKRAQERIDAMNKTMEGMKSQMASLRAAANRPVVVQGCILGSSRIRVRDSRRQIRLGDVKVGDFVCCCDPNPDPGDGRQAQSCSWTEVYHVEKSESSTVLYDIHYTHPVTGVVECLTVTDLHCVFVDDGSRDQIDVGPGASTKIAMSIEPGDRLWIAVDIPGEEEDVVDGLRNTKFVSVPVLLTSFREGTFDLTCLYTFASNVVLSCGVLVSVYEMSHWLQELDTRDMRALYRTGNSKSLDSWWFQAWSRFEDVVLYSPLEKALRWWHS